MLIKYIILGIIQGITEPIPVSSSGHILIFKKIFDIKLSDINFEIIVNFASFIAILFFYRKQIIIIIKDFFSYITSKDINKKDNFDYAVLIIIGTIPICIFGFILKDTIEKLSTNIKLIGFALLITSCALYLIKDDSGTKDKKDITKYDAFKIGLYQILALFPGISRSGTTIFASLKCNLKRNEATTYSFMLYLPVSLATIILGISDIIKIPNISKLLPLYIISFTVSLITTYISLKWFVNIVKKGKLIYFSIYCFIIGIITILFF